MTYNKKYIGLYNIKTPKNEPFTKLLSSIR